MGYQRTRPDKRPALFLYREDSGMMASPRFLTFSHCLTLVLCGLLVWNLVVYYTELRPNLRETQQATQDARDAFQSFQATQRATAADEQRRLSLAREGESLRKQQIINEAMLVVQQERNLRLAKELADALRSPKPRKD